MKYRWMLEALHDMQTFSASNNLWDCYSALEKASEALAKELGEQSNYVEQKRTNDLSLADTMKSIFPKTSFKKW